MGGVGSVGSVGSVGGVGGVGSVGSVGRWGGERSPSKKMGEKDKGKKYFRTHEDLAIYQLAFETAMQIFEHSTEILHLACNLSVVFG